MSLILDRRSVEASAEEPCLYSSGSIAALEKEVFFPPCSGSLDNFLLGAKVPRLTLHFLRKTGWLWVRNPVAFLRVKSVCVYAAAFFPKCSHSPGCPAHDSPSLLHFSFSYSFNCAMHSGCILNYVQPLTILSKKSAFISSH